MIAFLFFLQKETEGPHRAGGRTSWTCGAPWWRKTPYVVQGARASLRDLALQLSILRRIPSRQVARGFPFAGREYSRWRRGLVKEILSATHSDQWPVRHIRTCTSKALLDGIDIRLGSSTNCQVSFCFPTQAEFCVGRSLPLVSPKCRPSFRHLLDQGLTCVTDCLFAHELCCVRCWCRPRSPSAIALAGCGGAPTVSRDMQPLSERVLAELKAKRMEKDSPILVRIFKEESELEVWKQDDSGRFALFRSYPICRFSGELGPKIKTGDRQAPEGFYTITPGLMNPNSSQYLAINTGFPNAYDRANGRTGSFLMIHGGCSSAGCYAMTDEQMAEIYALAREAFFGGQTSFQLQAYPFRMTPLNMARHRNSPHMAFWRMLKEGHDHFEVTHLEPRVGVCEKRYIFEAESTASFGPADRCPAYRVPEDIVAAVGEKQRRDEMETADLINRGIPSVAAPVGAGGAVSAAAVLRR